MCRTPSGSIYLNGLYHCLKNNAAKLTKLEGIRIPENFDYSRLKSLSYEAREKLSQIQPRTISQASRISGVSPNDISVLLVFMGR